MVNWLWPRLGWLICLVRLRREQQAAWKRTFTFASTTGHPTRDNTFTKAHRMNVQPHDGYVALVY